MATHKNSPDHDTPSRTPRTVDEYRTWAMKFCTHGKVRPDHGADRTARRDECVQCKVDSLARAREEGAKRAEDPART